MSKWLGCRPLISEWLGSRNHFPTTPAIQRPREKPHYAFSSPRRSAMQNPYTLAQANCLLPLVQAIVNEIIERRVERRGLKKQIGGLESAFSPEGLCLSLSELDAQLAAADEGIERSRRELERLGLVVMRTNPVT